MPSHKEANRAKASAQWEASSELAHKLALKELEVLSISPDSSAGAEFLLRVDAFGIMGVQPPRTDLDGALQKIVGPDAIFVHG